MSEAAGPWRAQVVDAETGEPLAGVAVIGVWNRRLIGHGLVPLWPTGWVGADEATTDAAGRFTLPRRFFAPALVTHVPEPELSLFKAGYGGWRLRDREMALTRPGAVIELRPLRSPDARRKYVEGRWTREERAQLRTGWRDAEAPPNWIDLPYQDARGLEAAINQERAALGLRPIGLGYPHLGTKYLQPAPPAEGPAAAWLRGASAVAIDAAGLRYVADTEHHRIVVLDPSGAMVRTWGRFGREPGAFQYPRGLALDRAGTLYVADWGNHRIQRFARDGRRLGQFGGLRFEDFDGLFNSAGPMEVVSGAIGKERVHFRAPPAARLEQEMTAFLNWYNRPADTDEVLKAGLSHLWFVTIHPFDDGNGRIARAITDMALARSERSSQRFYSMSTQIQQERAAYYDILEQTQKGTMDITPWMGWFLNNLGRAIDGAPTTLGAVLAKARVWESLQGASLNERQTLVLYRLLDGFEGKLTTSKYAKLTKSSQDTAMRDIAPLVERGILVRGPEGGRSTSYALANAYRGDEGAAHPSL